MLPQVGFGINPLIRKLSIFLPPSTATPKKVSHHSFRSLKISQITLNICWSCLSIRKKSSGSSTVNNAGTSFLVKPNGNQNTVWINAGMIPITNEGQKVGRIRSTWGGCGRKENISKIRKDNANNFRSLVLGKMGPFGPWTERFLRREFVGREKT